MRFLPAVRHNLRTLLRSLPGFYVGLWRHVMAYIDDWYATPSLVRAVLEESCSGPSCSHMRYQHGETRVVRASTGWSREVENTPGACTACRCRVFQEENAITEGDVIDFHEWFADVTTMHGLFVKGGVIS